MIVHEAVLHFQLARYGDDEPLTTTKRLLHYLTAGIAQHRTKASGSSA